MANPEHVAVVLKGAAYIKEWRRNHPGQTFDLREASLVDADLTNAILENANLENAELISADFEMAKYGIFPQDPERWRRWDALIEKCAQEMVMNTFEVLPVIEVE